VNPSNSTINASICAESSYTLPDGSSVSEAGSYLFTFTSAAGCDSIVTVNLTVDSAINITLSEDVEICPGTSINLTASGADSYLWLPGTGLSDSTGSSVVANPMTTTNYVVYGNSGLCSDVDTVTVTVLPGPQLQIDPSAAAICVGDTLSLVASGADVLIWSDTSGVSLSCDTCSTALAYPQESMTFILTGSVGQCSATTSVTVDVVPAVIAAISGDTTLCLGETVQLTASGGSSYNWSTGDSLAVVNVTVPASTFVTVEVSNGVCTDSATTALLVYPIPLVNAGEDTLIHYGTSAQIMASSNASGTWFPVNHLTCGDCLEPIADPPSTTTYCLTVVNSFGCAATDCIEITVDTLCADLFIPNVFAPDDAGHTENNCFKLYGADCIGTMTLTIYNRWGEKVFVSSNPDECWDGNFRGKPLNTGVYVYYLEAELITGESLSKQGNLTLMR
jgi:gliding motility-associated-like protein